MPGSPKRSECWRPADRPEFAGPALIDTHVWIWYLDGLKGRLSPAALNLLRRCVRGDGLVVSDISVWEVGMKAARGKLRMMPSPGAWIERASRRAGFSFLPLDRDILLSSTELPGVVHGDPADRMLIASAALAGIPLVTVDGNILDYASTQGGFSACDARA